MKLVLALSAAMSLLATSNAFACAMCVDVYPEITVMSSEVTTALLATGKIPSDEKLSLSDISCSKGTLMSELAPSCVINAGYDNNNADKIEIQGDAARILYSQIANITVEVNYQGDADDGEGFERDFKRTAIAMLNQTMEKNTVSIPMINVGSISCPVVNGAQRCEMELNVLNAYLFNK